jgi:uncharacterized SAM-binding protein YcdF (DUF218 family)
MRTSAGGSNLASLGQVAMCNSFVLRRRSILTGALVSVVLIAFLCSRMGALILLSIIRYGALPSSAGDAKQPEAIVLLAADYGRVERSAWQYRQTGLPVLVTGGNMDENLITEAAWMEQTLRVDFNVPVKWVEDRAQTTEESAMYSAELLKRNGIRQVMLVTDDRHMLRARLLFGAYGIDVFPTPVRYSGHLESMAFSVSDLFPSWLGWRLTRSVLHEVGGIAWFYLVSPEKFYFSINRDYGSLLRSQSAALQVRLRVAKPVTGKPAWTTAAKTGIRNRWLEGPKAA